MRTYTKKLTKGFTIIEVLIVLAIAGLILAIIFLAVPALQRNSRNTAIRSDAAGVLAAVNDYIANNSGSLPTGATFPDGPGTSRVSINGSGTSAEARVRGGTGVTFSPSMPGLLGNISIATGFKCNTTGSGFAASARSVAAGFLVENTSATNAPQCIES